MTSPEAASIGPEPKPPTRPLIYIECLLGKPFAVIPGWHKMRTENGLEDVHPERILDHAGHIFALALAERRNPFRMIVSDGQGIVWRWNIEDWASVLLGWEGRRP